MKYQTRKVKHLTDLQLLAQLHLGAKIYSKYAESALLLIFSGGKNKPYEAYEVFAHKYNFMHLAGVKSQTLGAAEFYQACLEGKIKREDCSPVHSVSNMYSKVSVLNQLLDLKNSKCYKIGEKDLVTKNNDFEMAIGNSSGVVGYDHRISLKGTNIVDKTKLPMPTTLITTPITQLVSKPEKIIFILQRNLDEEKYGKIFFEIKKDLLQEEYYLLPAQIRQHINPLVQLEKEVPS